MSRYLARLGVVTTAAAALIVGGGSFAGAHVSVHADDATQGGSAEVAFRVPTESDTASTTTVKVAFPVDTPVTGVTVLPLAGWTSVITRTTLPAPVDAGHGERVSEVVGEIEWRAAGPDAAVKPGEYQVFRIAGTLPEADEVVFKVVQTYDDGQVRRWIDESVAGRPEPDHPAPVLAIDAAAAAHGHNEVTDVTPAASAQATTPAPAWWTAVTIAIVAMIVSLASVVVAIRTTQRRGGANPTA